MEFTNKEVISLFSFVVFVFLLGAIIGAWFSVKGLQVLTKKYCIEKAQTKEDVFKCDKFPWEG